MDELIQKSDKKLRNKRCQELIESLANMRVKDCSDVVLVAGGKQFFVHKAVLQSSGPYFKAMFSSGMQETESRRILFEEMKPETMQSLLDFIYLGSVKNIKSAHQVMEVLTACHLMHLEDLYSFCCNSLKNLVSPDNYFEIVQIALTYDVDMQPELLYFWVHNSEKIVASKSFLDLSCSQLKEITMFLKAHLICLDSILLGLSMWLKNDVAERKDFIIDLLDCTDVKLLTKNCIILAVTNKELTRVSLEVAAKMNELFVPGLTADGYHLVDNPFLKVDASSKIRVILFSSQYSVDVFDVDKTCASTEQFRYGNCIQQFDLGNMVWLPLQSQPYNCTTAALCQFKNCICIIGGDYGLGLMYNVQDKLFTPLPCESVNDRLNAAACYFKSNLYVIGGTMLNRDANPNGNWVSSTSVCYLEPGSDIWRQASPCKAIHSISARLLALTSSKFIYIVGCYQYPQKETIVQYNPGPHSGYQWESIHLHSERELISSNNFFVFHDSLNAMFIEDGNTVLLTYDHRDKKMKTKMFRSCPENVSLVTHVYVTNQNSALFVSTDLDQFLPTHLWDPETGKWTDLPRPEGRRRIPYACNRTVYMY